MKRLVLALGTGVVLAACKPPAVPEPPASPSPSPTAPPTATPTPTPTVAPTPTPTPPPPTPEPTPLVPRKPMDVGKMFNGITYKTRFLTPESDQLASVERVDDAAYQVEIAFTAKLPRPSTTLEDLASNDPKLPHVLNKMSDLVAGAQVSPFFEQLYKTKIATIREDLFALNEVLSRHNFYDCETILQLKDPTTARKALLVIGDMDVNVDGSDGDRNVEVDDSGRFFQPQTSYRWRKTTDRVNPFLPKAQARLAELKAELAAPATTATRKRELQAAIEHTTRTISDLKSSSFLVSAADPTIVVPTFMLRSDSPYAPSIGDYGAVIYDGVVYPVIVGDAGPSAKVGEASVRLCRQINPKSSSLSRAVSSIKVAYLIFPGTAEKPGPPDLDHWRTMCQKYLDEIGGAAPELFAWENIVPPWPTPTPTPTPEPTPTPTPTPEPAGLTDPAAPPGAPAVVTPPVTPEPSATPAASPSVTPAVITP